MKPPDILDNWEAWKYYLEFCPKEDFYKVLKALTDRRNQTITIMNQRKLDPRDPDKPITYKTDHEATSNYVPYPHD